MIRRRTRPAGDQVVAVTGAAGGLGRALLERLARHTDLAAVVGIDVVTARVDGVLWRRGDVRDPLLRGWLAGVGTVVHLATTSDVGLDPVERRARNIRGTAALLEAARAAGVGRVVVVTSAEVYGASPRNRVPLPDTAPVRALSGADLLGDHVEVERLVAAAGLPVAVLRPAALVGGALGPAYDGALLRQLSAPRLLAPRGDDLLAALELVVTAGLTGPLPVGCIGALPQTVVERISGRRRVELPAAVALSTAERLHRLGVSSATPRELDHLLGPVVVGSTRLLAAGWAPAWTNETALRAYLADRAGGDVRAGAYTAAGATVALLGTAALVRRSRRRRRGI
jgi:uncharacterized protein YbjT (DUF2867 family)